MDSEATRARIAELEATVERLSRDLAASREQIAKLTELLEAARKEAARQAAPFRRPETKKVVEPRKPGRKAGHPGVNRPIPKIIDEVIDVPLEVCPQCGGPVGDCIEVVQYIEEVPVVRPKVTKLTTRQGTCGHCGPVASTHPLQTGAGHHASGVQLGPRALALAVILNKHHGLTMRKTCKVLKDGFGLSLSPGGLSHALVRIAGRLDGDYQALFADLRAGPATYVDETSWWVGGPGQWLWVFTSPTTTAYRIEDKRSSVVVSSTLGFDYTGVLVSDCLNSYDAAPCAAKHKCIAHHQKAIREQLDQPTIRDRSYLEAWRSFFRGVCAVVKVWPLLPPENQAAARVNYARQRDELLARPVTQPEDQRIRNRLLKQQPYLLTCLEREGVEATNNRAERALRPAVIARKVSCGNKTANGKHAFEVLASLAQTCLQRGFDLVTHFTDRCRLNPPAVG